MIPTLIVLGELVFYLIARIIMHQLEPKDGEGKKEGTMLAMDDAEIHHRLGMGSATIVQVGVTNGTNMTMSANLLSGPTSVDHSSLIARQSHAASPEYKNGDAGGESRVIQVRSRPDVF
jgi:hypothetical protein